MCLQQMPEVHIIVIVIVIVTGLSNYCVDDHVNTFWNMSRLKNVMLLKVLTHETKNYENHQH